MAPKRKPARPEAASDPDGTFRGVSAFVVPHAVQSRRLEVWKQRLMQMGDRVQEKLANGAAATHVPAVDGKALLRELDAAWLHRFRGSVVSFEWLEECLKSGERLLEHKFVINYEKDFKPKKAAGTEDSGASQPAKRSKISSEDPENYKETSGQEREKELAAGGHQDASTHVYKGSGSKKGPSQYASSQSSSGDTKDTMGSHGTFDIEEASSGEPTTYAPPDVNRNITEIFGKLINIYRVHSSFNNLTSQQVFVADQIRSKSTR